MIPKDKAQELCNKFKSVRVFGLCSEEPEIDYKESALICVDEFLDFMNNLIITEGSLAYQYWNEVKQEIEKL